MSVAFRHCHVFLPVDVLRGFAFSRLGPGCTRGERAERTPPVKLIITAPSLPVFSFPDPSSAAHAARALQLKAFAREVWPTKEVSS